MTVTPHGALIVTSKKLKAIGKRGTLADLDGYVASNDFVSALMTVLPERRKSLFNCYGKALRQIEKRLPVPTTVCEPLAWDDAKVARLKALVDQFGRNFEHIGLYLGVTAPAAAAAYRRFVVREVAPSPRRKAVRRAVNLTQDGRSSGGTPSEVVATNVFARIAEAV